MVCFAESIRDNDVPASFTKNMVSQTLFKPCLEAVSNLSQFKATNESVFCVSTKTKSLYPSTSLLDK